MQSNSVRALLIAVSLASAGSVMAADETIIDPAISDQVVADPTISKLSAVQSETILLKAMAEREETKLKLDKLMNPKKYEEAEKAALNNGMGGMNNPLGFNHQPNYPVPMAPPKAEPAPIKVDPVVAPVIPPVAAPVEAPVVAPVVAPKAEPPQLRGVIGGGTKLFATLAYSNGSEVEARVGDKIPGEFRVLSITMNKIVLAEKNGKRIEVLKSDSFGSFPEPAETQQQKLNGLLDQRPVFPMTGVRI